MRGERRGNRHLPPDTKTAMAEATKTQMFLVPPKQSGCLQNLEVVLKRM